MDIPDTVWAALITGGFLITQQVITGRRERARRSEDLDERQRDRQHQVDLEEQRRRDAIEERWRDDRRAAHLRLLSSADSAIREIYRWHTFPDARPESAFTTGLSPESGKELAEAAEDVMLIGSPESQRAAGACVAAIESFNVHVLGATSPPSPLDREVLDALGNCDRAVKEYRRTVQSDLGTAPWPRLDAKEAG